MKESPSATFAHDRKAAMTDLSREGQQTSRHYEVFCAQGWIKYYSQFTGGRINFIDCTTLNRFHKMLLLALSASLHTKLSLPISRTSANYITGLGATWTSTLQFNFPCFTTSGYLDFFPVSETIPRNPIGLSGRSWARWKGGSPQHKRCSRAEKQKVSGGRRSTRWFTASAATVFFSVSTPMTRSVINNDQTSRKGEAVFLNQSTKSVVAHFSDLLLWMLVFFFFLRKSRSVARESPLRERGSVIIWLP